MLLGTVITKGEPKPYSAKHLSELIANRLLEIDYIGKEQNAKFNLDKVK